MSPTTTSTIPAPNAAPVLNATDRCDKCGAQAFVRTVYTSGHDLLFCKHHANQYSAAIASQAVSVHDESHLLNEKPSPSAY